MASGSDFTYYALINNSGKAGGLLRRSREGLCLKDESLRADFTRQPSEFLEKYELGHNDSDYIEITDVEARSLIEEWRSRNFEE